MINHYFATLFDVNYLSRGLCLIESLDKVLTNQYKIFVLALDQEVVGYFQRKNLKHVIIVKLSEAETFYPELKLAKKNRSLIEYYFTLSPILPLYILEKYKFCDRVTSLDADLYFFSSPGPFFKSLNNNEILITPHDFSSHLKDLNVYGTYNVSFQSFPNTENALDLLKIWKNKCLNWCKDELDLESRRFADQLYLDDWIKNFKNVTSISLDTMSRAPWNISDTSLHNHSSLLLVNKFPLIYYHFHHLRINKQLVCHSLDLYKVKNITPSIKKMYSIYIKMLVKKEKEIFNKVNFQVLRYNVKPYTGLLLGIWRLGQGAILLGNNVCFFNLTLFKKYYSKFKNILHG